MTETPNQDFTSAIAQAQIEMENRICNETSRISLAHHLPQWLDNLGRNLIYCRGGKTIKDIKPAEQKEAAVVVGASPYLTDEQISALQGWEGIVISCQKPLRRLLEHGVRPEWVCAIDSDPIMREHLSGSFVEKFAPMTKALVRAEIDPQCLTFFAEHFKETYYFIGAIHDEAAKNVTETMCKIAKLDSAEHGGNTGTAAYLLARRLGCNPIGMMGMEMCCPPDPKWSKQKAEHYEYVFNPEKNEFMAISSAFQAYIVLQHRAIQEAAKEKIDTYSLMDYGIWAALPYLSAAEFVKKFGDGK